jgi:hypothetical protein
MALDKSKLKSLLEEWMSGSYSDTNQSINKFAEIIEEYAKDATTTLSGTIAVYNVAGVISSLTGLSNVTSSTPSSSAQLFENAINAFWTGGTFILPAIVVVGLVSPLLIATPLTVVFSDINSDIGTKASQIADLLDTAVKTIPVTLAVSPFSPGTIL